MRFKMSREVVKIGILMIHVIIIIRANALGSSRSRSNAPGSSPARLSARGKSRSGLSARRRLLTVGVEVPSRMRVAGGAVSYQICARSLSGLTIGSPGLQPKASAKAGILESGPMVRNSGGA